MRDRWHYLHAETQATIIVLGAALLATLVGAQYV